MPHLIQTENSRKIEGNLNGKLFLQFAENSPFSWWLADGQSKLPPEIERDNVEYKWKLTGMSEERRVHLVTQMRWRVGELGYCWYILGVKDNGDLEGVTEDDLKATLCVLEDLVRRANLSIDLIQTVIINPGRLICQVRIQLEASERFVALELQVRSREGRVLFLGAAGCGKTTLLSVLGDWGSRDDGRGKMRTRLLHHRHELLTGTTSSITHQPIVFLNKTDVPLCLADDSVLLQLERRREVLGEGLVVQLIDSAGKLRFNRTVFSVLTSAAHPPDLAFIVLEAPTTSSLTIIPPQTIETFRLLDRLGISTALLISKIDQSSTEAISLLLEEFSTHFAQKNLLIYSEDEKDDNNRDDLPVNSSNDLPVLLTSAVSGDFLPLLSHFIHSSTRSPLPHFNNKNKFIHAQESASAAIVIEQVAQLAEVGTVVYGQVAFGTVWVGDEMVLGPMERGDGCVRVRVKSIQRLKCPVNSASPSQHVSLALQFLSNCSTTTRKGMAVLKLRSDSHSLTLKPLKRIIAEIELVSGLTQQRYIGSLFVMGQRFPATLDLQPRTMRRASSTNTNTTTPANPTSTTSTSVCLVTFSEKRPATVFLFPTAPIIFIGNGRKEILVGKVIDYFA